MMMVILAHSWFNLYAPEHVPIFYYLDKTRVQMFYFLNININRKSERDCSIVLYVFVYACVCNWVDWWVSWWVSVEWHISSTKF